VAEITPDRRLEIERELSRLTLEQKEHKLEILSLLSDQTEEQREMVVKLNKALAIARDTVEYKDY